MIKKQLILWLLFLLIFPRIVCALDEEEIKFGYFLDRYCISMFPLLINEPLSKRIEEIGSRVIKTSDGPKDIKYTFRILNDTTINAFSASGGFIYITTGLLDILESEDEVAAIIAREVAHINKSHLINKVRTLRSTLIALDVAKVVITMAASAAGSAASMAAGAASSAAASSVSTIATSFLASTASKLAVNALGTLAANAIATSALLGYERSKEFEADELAIQYLLKAGYDPNALINVYRKCIGIRDWLKLDEKKYASSLMNASPGLDERMKNAQELISKSKK